MVCIKYLFSSLIEKKNCFSYLCKKIYSFEYLDSTTANSDHNEQQQQQELNNQLQTTEIKRQVSLK
jgi:hypothetical protein